MATQPNALTEQMWDPIAALREKYPAIANEPDAKVAGYLAQPKNFRAAFPEYAHLDDDYIARNMAAIGRKQGEQAAKEAEAAYQPAQQSMARGAAVGAFKGLGIPITPEPVTDLAKGVYGRGKDYYTSGDWWRDMVTGGQHTLMKTGKGLVEGVVEPSKQVYEGVREGDWEKAAEGGGNLMAQAGGVLLGTKRGQAAMSRVTQPILRAGEATGQAAVKTATAIRHPVSSIERWYINRQTPAQNMMKAAQPSVQIPRARESFEMAGPEIQRAVKRSGLEIRGDEAMPNTLEATRLAKREIWDTEIKPRLAAAGTFEADLSPVANAIERNISKRTLETNPGLAERLQKRADFYRNRRMSLDDVELFIEDANSELKGYYKSTDPNVTPGTAASKAEVEALRGIFNRQLDKATSPGVAAAKRKYGALRDVERSLEKQIIVRARQRGVPLYEALGMLGAAGDLASAAGAWNALGMLKAGGRIAVGQAMSRVRDPNVLLEHAFHGENAFKTAPQPIAFQPPPVKGLLPPAPPGTAERAARIATAREQLTRDQAIAQNPNVLPPSGLALRQRMARKVLREKGLPVKE